MKPATVLTVFSRLKRLRIRDRSSLRSLVTRVRWAQAGCSFDDTARDLSISAPVPRPLLRTYTEQASLIRVEG